MSTIKVGLRYIDRWNTSLEKEVARYEAENAEKGQIVFYGPSYFTRWSERYGNVELRDVILGKSGAKCCLNRGFGSSCPEQQLYYYPRMVRALEAASILGATYVVVHSIEMPKELYGETCTGTRPFLYKQKRI